MIANLKDKAAGLADKAAAFDKKRLYTAFSALVIAGAAGYFMQRGVAPQPSQPMTAALVPTPVAPAQSQPMTPAEPETLAAAASAPAPAEGVAQAPVVSPDVALVDPEPETGPESGPESGSVDLASIEPSLPELDVPDAEVTRSASEPILALATPSPVPAVAPVEVAPIVTAALEDALVPDVTPPTPAATAEHREAACAITMTATAQPGALVWIDLQAPCNSGEDVNFEHLGLRFSEQFDTGGGVQVLAPALATDAVYSAEFESGQIQTVKTNVPDVADFERVALIWKGATGLQLHALENGARYGEPGHIWAENPELADRAVAGEGGFVSVLGSTANGYAADVYTFPAKLMGSGETPDVSIEAQVMENTCGGQIDGTYLRSNLGLAPSFSDLSMMIPACDAVGEYLVLKNLPQDLKLARN